MNNAFGKYLRAVREHKKLTINQLAMYSKVSSALISRIENGQRSAPKPETLLKLSEALKIPYEVMMEQAGYAASKATYPSKQTNPEIVLEQTTTYPNDAQHVIKVPVYTELTADDTFTTSKPVDYLYMHSASTESHSFFGIVNRSEDFIAEGIKPGCKLLIKQQPAVESGKFAMCSFHEGESLQLKRIFKQDDLLILQGSSQEPPLIKACEDVTIYGQVVQVICDC